VRGRETVRVSRAARERVESPGSAESEGVFGDTDTAEPRVGDPRSSARTAVLRETDYSRSVWRARPKYYPCPHL